jgi:di/tricarboxylate transporter
MTAAAILVLLAILGWASGRVPAHLVALAFFLLAVLLEVAPPAVVFSGFTSGALWLIFGGQVMGVAIRHTGLAERLADAAVRRIGARSYGSVIAGVVGLSAALGFVLPSAMGRVVLLMPIASALAERYGFRETGKGRTGILLAAAFGTTFPSLAILPANVPNAVLLGAAEAQYGVTLGYFEYLVLHFPVLGVVKAVAIALLVVLLFPATLAAHPAPDGRGAPLSREERMVAALVSIAVALWATDWLHHVSPAWVSLGVALPILLPWLRLVPARAFDDQINYSSLFFVAGVIGVGAVISHTGLAEVLGRAVQAAFPLAPGAAAMNFASLSAIGIVLAAATTAPGMPAVMTPLARGLAHATGLPLETVLMSETLGFCTTVLPYQSPPLVVAAHLCELPRGATAKLSLAVFAASALAVLPLDYAWWRLLGRLG